MGFAAAAIPGEKGEVKEEGMRALSRMRISRVSMGAAPEPAGEDDDRRRVAPMLMRRGVEVDTRTTVEEQPAISRGQ
jgi:hypothetical protein